MKLAFCLFKFSPFGGVERDFMRVALACVQHGHEVDVYTMSWQGEMPKGMKIFFVPVRAVTNHGKAAAFSSRVQEILATKDYDLIIGFNKMAGLDVCFVGDVCFKRKIKTSNQYFWQFLPRYRTYLKLERAVFDEKASTQIMLLTPTQQDEYHKEYGTLLERMTLLPPGMEYRAPTKKVEKQKGRTTLLFVATKFYNKGLDRAINAMASLRDENIVLQVIGGDNPKTFLEIARRLGVERQVKFLGAQFDLFEPMVSSDILIHPARVEGAGMVLLEAIIAGLPILTTAACGYAFHVENAEAGVVVKEPFNQSAFNSALAKMLRENKLTKWHDAALEYAKVADLYHLGDKAVELIERCGSRE